MENIDTEVLLEKLIYWNHHDDKDKKEIRKIEAELNIAYISVSVEKHNELQYTYYFEVDYGSHVTDQIFFIEIENGINNGTQINHADWGSDTKPENRVFEVLKDVILDKSQYPELGERRKAQAVLNSNKQKFFDFHRQNKYDNYVTGGNSSLKLDGIISKLHVEYIYEEVKADVHFV